MFHSLTFQKEVLLVGIGGAGCNFIEFAQNDLKLDDANLMVINADERINQFPESIITWKAWTGPRWVDNMPENLRCALEKPRHVVIVTGSGNFSSQATISVLKRLAVLTQHVLQPVLIAPFSFEDTDRQNNFRLLKSALDELYESSSNCIKPQVFSNAELSQRYSKNISLLDFFTKVNRQIAQFIGLTAGKQQ